MMNTSGMSGIFVANTGSVHIKDNFIQNIRVENSGSGNALFQGIVIYDHSSAIIEGNAIGGPAGGPGIELHGNENSFIGIRTVPCLPISILNNSVSNITMLSSSGTQNFNGILYEEGSDPVIIGNTISQVNANSMGAINFTAITSIDEFLIQCDFLPQPPVFDQNLINNISLYSGNDNIIFKGIEVKSSGSALQLHNNQVNRISISAPYGTAGFTAVEVNDRIAFNTGNIIGSATEANSILVSGNSAFANGIVLNNSPDISVTDDIIANITAVGTVTPSSVNGIVFENGMAANISGNQIHHLVADNPIGVFVRPTEGSSLVTLADNVLTGLDTGTGIETYASQSASLSLVVTGNTVTQWQTGVSVDAAAGAALTQSFSSNSVVDNETGFANNGSTAVNANCNWWGHASGPGGAGPGSGDPVGANVIFSPWATTENYVEVNAGPDQTIYKGYGPASKTITPSITYCGPVSILWSTGATTPSITVSPAVTTTYSVTVTDARGHQATDEVTVHVADVRCGNKGSKVMICHKGKMICVSASAVNAHLNHGDVLGACTDAIASRQVGGPALMEEAEISELKVYPNPADRLLLLQWNSETSDMAVINIADVSGRVVFTRKISQVRQNKNQLLLPVLGSGNYVIWLQSGETRKKARLLISRFGR